MSKTTDSLRRASASRDAQTTAVEAQARVDAQNLILNENKRLAEINSEQAGAVGIAAFGPIAVPVLGASKVLERVLSPKN